MRFYKSAGLVLTLSLILSACATAPDIGSKNGSGKNQSSKSSSEPFNEKPGDFVLENDTANIIYRVLIAELSVQRGDANVASEFYLDAAKKSQDPRVAARAVRVANFAENKADALEAAKIWVAAEPDNHEASRILAILYLREDNTEKAQEILSRLLSKDKDSLSRNLLLTGAMLQRETSLENAEKVAKHLTNLYPDMAESHYVHASLAMQSGLAEPALVSIEKSLAIRPDWIDAVVLYPRILQENAQPEKALNSLKSYLQDNPKQDAVRLAYARALVDTRNLKEARNQFELLAVKIPNDHDVLYALAMLAMQFQDFDEAEGYLNQLEKLGKSNNQVIFYLGQIAEQKELHTKAIETYSRIRSDTLYIESQLRIAAILAKTQSIEAAREHMQRINSTSDGEKRQIALFEGNLLRDFKKYQESYDFFTQLLEINEKDLDFLYFRSLVAERLDKIDVVIEDLNYVIENDPENAAALNALGYTLADRTDRFQEALELIERARKIDPDDPAIIDSLGWVNYKLGNNQLALKYLAEAMAQIDDGEVAAHYGELLWVTGDKDKAKTVWEKAKEEHGGNEILIKTLKRFGL